MIGQRQVSQGVDHLRQRGGGIVNLALVVGLEDQGPRIEKAIAQPRAVAHQMTNGDRTLGRVSLVQRRRAATQHTAIRKLRNEPLDRVVHSETAVFEQKERGTGRNQLRIGEDAKDVIGPQGYPRFLVGPADAAHIDQIPTDEHRGGEPGQKIPINVALHGGVRRPKVMAGGRDFHVFHDWLASCPQ